MNEHDMSDRTGTGRVTKRAWLKCVVSLAMLALLACRGNGADAPLDEAKSYGECIRSSKELLGYWPMAGSLKADAGGLELVSANPKLMPGEGPLGMSSVDLSDGNYLSINPGKEFDAPQMGVEMLFEIVKPTAGNLCLFAVRSEKSTRFSLHYNPGENVLILYNGTAVSRFECNDILVLKEWFHIALGIAGGNGAAWLLKVPPVIPLDWAALGLLICSLVGLVFGTYPAIRAARLDPIESLRYE
jgi:hypothetical protein